MRVLGGKGGRREKRRGRKKGRGRKGGEVDEERIYFTYNLIIVEHAS